MQQAQEAKSNQIVLLITLGVFLIGVALNYYAPSPTALRQEIARLKQSIQEEKRKDTGYSTCPVDTACQAELTELKRKNWVMENDAIRQRIDEIRNQIEVCRKQVSEASETAATDYECTRRMGLLNSQNEEEISILNKELRAFQDKLKSLKNEFEDYERTVGRKITEKEKELLNELDKRTKAK